MEKIIHDFAIKLITDWTELIRKEGVHNLDSLSKDLLKLNNATALEMLSAILTKLDTCIVDSKSMRKDLGLRIKERGRSREYLTCLGILKYNRSYYENSVIGGYCCPLDDVIDVHSYERISPGLCADVVNRAAYVSMRRSAEDVTGGELSAQSVCNKVRALGIVEKEAPELRRVINELHIFADEDHASLRDGGIKRVPLVSMCEGIEKVGTNRRASVNMVHFTSDISESAALWRCVYAYADRVYDMDKVAKIYIHGDGASWIKKGLDEFCSASFLLDGFHLKRRLAPFICDDNAGCIQELIRGNRRDDFEMVAKAVINGCDDDHRKKSLRENLKYLLNQWEGVVNRYTLNTIGSCTEAMVSHVLSERLSRNPMGWSVDGLNNLAALRVYVKNGEEVRKEHFRRSAEQKQTSTLAQYADEMIKSFLDFKIDYTFIRKQNTYKGKVTPISVILKSFASIKTDKFYAKN